MERSVITQTIIQNDGLFAPSESVWFERECAGNQYLYVINGTPGRTFTFNALNGLFVKDNSRLIYCCSISLKGEDYQICRLTEEDFWLLVKGKRFRVISDNNTFRINADFAEDKESVLEKTLRVFSLLDTGNEYEASVLIKPAPCYQLVEVPVDGVRSSS